MPLLKDNSSASKVNLTASQLQGTIIGQADTNYIITASATGKTFTFSAAGAIGHWTILRGNSDSDKSADWPELTNCQIHLIGTYGILGYGLRLNNCAVFVHDGSW